MTSLTIVRLCGPPTEVAFRGDMTVLELKEQLSGLWNTPADQLNLLFSNRYLHDEYTLSQCGFVGGEKLAATLKLASGMPIKVSIFGVSEVTVLVVPYQLVGDIIEDLDVSCDDYSLYDDNGKSLDNHEFCAYVANTLRKGVTLREKESLST